MILKLILNYLIFDVMMNDNDNNNDNNNNKNIICHLNVDWEIHYQSLEMIIYISIDIFWNKVKVH